MITLSRNIRSATVQCMRVQTAGHLSNALDKVCKLHGSSGYIVDVMLMDMEFDPVAAKMPHITVNTVAAREHVAEIEHEICVVKERDRATLNTLPFQTFFQ